MMTARLSQRRSKKPFNDQTFRALVEKSHDVIVLLDKKGKLLYATPSIERLYGRSVKDITGVTSFRYIYPTDIPRVANAIKNLTIHPDKSLQLQIRVKHKNGSWRWIEAVGTNFLNDDQIGAIIVNFHDITEFKDLEEQKDEFISIASHELKTPMTIIKSYTTLLKKHLSKGSNDKLTSQFLTKLDEQVDRFSLLVNELLDVTALQKGSLPLKKDRFHLDALVKEIVEQESFVHQEIPIIFKAKKLPLITADKFKISQVIYNILSNAIKYSPQHTEVMVRIRKDQSHIHVDIRDQGKGIKDEDIKHIFDRFYRGEHTSSINGLGLGLYISHEIIHQHGGKITVKSEVGKGSTFTISFPLTLPK